MPTAPARRRAAVTTEEEVARALVAASDLAEFDGERLRRACFDFAIYLLAVVALITAATS